MANKTKLYHLEENAFHLEHLRLAVKRIHKGKHKNLNFHDHDYSEVAIITSAGRNTLHWANGKSHRITRGDVLLLHSGIVHAYENTGCLALTNIIYNANSLPIPPLDGYNLKCLEHFFAPSFQSPEAEKPILHLDEKQLKTVYNLTVKFEEQLSSNLPGKHLCAFGLFLAMFVEIARAGNNLPASAPVGSLATPALQFINLHFCENVKMEYLASLCHLSICTFYRHFKRLTGYSPTDYLLHKRLEHARQMLSTSPSSLKYIAEVCGFCDTSHFIAMFSKCYGTPPGKYRQQALQGE